MADYSQTPRDVPGPGFVDSTCTPCRTRLKLAGADLVLKDNADESYVFFHEQPEGDEELAIADEVLAVCPQIAVGNDGA